jgi:hypothetical protein
MNTPVSEIERVSPLASPPDRSAIKPTTAPLHGATQTEALRAGLWASGRPASREARVPAGQHTNVVPLGA